MKKRISVNKKSKDWKARYPLVEIYWLDILSDPSWQSLKGVMQMELPTCVTKGHLVSQTKGVTRVFGDHSLNKENSIDEVGNVTIIPNSVIKDIKKI